MAEWGQKKGINLLATGDITHPKYVEELKEKLVEDGSGLLTIRPESFDGAPQSQSDKKNNFPAAFLTAEASAQAVAREVKFILSGEISCIYKDKGKTRRLHHVIFIPDFKTLDEFNKRLTDRGCNLKSDGRPIIGLSSKELLQILLDVNPDSFLVPAHAWTPWFAIFGSKSGYDSIEECFEDLSPQIFALETGLSSDPAMNWRLSALDNITLISNSDAHSPANLGREANVFNFTELTFAELKNILKNKDSENFLRTIEFYPQEGKYHYDGHRDCGVCFSPEDSLKHKNICPKCQKPLVLGVDHRIAELADREVGFKPVRRIPFQSIIPLAEIISEVLGVGKQSKKVTAVYNEMITAGDNEFNILLNLDRTAITSISSEIIAEAIMRMRLGKISARPGYDGEFGRITVFAAGELKKIIPAQSNLFS